MKQKSIFPLFVKALLVLTLALLIGRTSPAAADVQATCTSGGTGSWTSITWTGCASGPQSGDDVIIASGHTVTLNTSPVTINSLTINNAGTLNMNTQNNTSRTMTVSGSVTINTGGTITLTDPPGANPNTHTLNVGGDFVNNGTFTSTNGNDIIAVIFNGTSPQTISGSSTTGFDTLTVNSGATVIIPGTNIPVVATSLTNNGTLQQTRPVNNASVDFLHITNSGGTTVQYRGVTVNTTVSGANLGDTTVSVRRLNTGEYCTTDGGTSPNYTWRCYEITPTTSGAAQVRLYALTASELNGIAQGNLSVYRNLPDGSGTWVELTTNRSTGSASGGYSYAEGDTPGFSHFLLGQTGNAPTAVTLTTFTTAAHKPVVVVLLFSFVTLSLLFVIGWRLAVIRNR
ncbi:MAG TPA: G8 domain-containing protein [Chloroflexota bacterium]|nr:G8 domain-containing protein [Chloroflexota bacterium]HUM68890.1 G8 domain-containing protein [Chloroflexota bacterium]